MAPSGMSCNPRCRRIRPAGALTGGGELESRSSPPELGADDGCITMQLYREHFQIVLEPSHRLAAQKQILVKDPGRRALALAQSISSSGRPAGRDLRRERGHVPRHAKSSSRVGARFDRRSAR